MHLNQSLKVSPAVWKVFNYTHTEKQIMNYSKIKYVSEKKYCLRMTINFGGGSFLC